MMATAVVSGRVDERVKRDVDRVLARKGTTSGEVIKQVWAHIYKTGELPELEAQEEEFLEKRRRYQAFIEFVQTLPPVPEWFLTMTDKEMNDFIADEMLKEMDHV
jgi:antitoxin component of RelBE/YafQ-DinJ toxin-antitoxin module